MIIKVKVITKASQDIVIPATDARFNYKVKTTAVAEHGKANERVLELMARYLQIKQRQLTIVAGTSSNLKTIAIDE